MRKITEIVESNGGCITSAEAADDAQYLRLVRGVERGELIKLKHGVFAVPEVLVNTMIDVERIVPRGVVCLYSAWMHYQLTMEVQPAYCIAIEEKRKVRLPEELNVRLYYWQQKMFDFGIVESMVSGFQVKITDIERSVCDAIKYRNKIGQDTCAEVLRNYMKRQDRNLSKLNEYAQKLRVAKTLKNYLEVLLVE